MAGRWEYDYEYFQQMIKRDRRMNAEVIGCIITGMSELNKKKNSSSDDDSMPGLQDRAKEDSSSNGDTDLYVDDVIYDDGEYWGYKA